MDFADREETMVEGGAAVGRLPLGAFLVGAGVASEEDIQDAPDECIRTRERLAQVVLRRGWVSEKKLATLLADQNSPGVERAQSPVDLVGAWLRPTDTSAHGGEEAQGRDVPDQAPIDEVNFEEDRVEAIDQLHEQTQSAAQEPTFPAVPVTGSVVEHLHALTAEVETLEHELLESRRQIEAQEAELVELRQARASDLDTISSLGAELEERRGRLDALRAAVGDLAVELDK
jgi:hypothetical protein